MGRKFVHLLSIAAVVLLAATSSAVAATTIDIRGDWAEQSQYGGTSSYVMHWTTEDFSSGAVSGTGGQPGNDQWSQSGTIDGNHLVFTDTYYGGGYSSTEDVTVAADGNSYSGTFHDINGATGTITASRTSGPPGGGGGGGGGLRPSGTTVACNLEIATASDTCTAQVADAGAPPAVTPTGQVTFKSDNGGVFSAGNSCGLQETPGSPGVASCSVQFLPPAAGGFPQIGAAYGGDAQHQASNGHTQFIIAAVPPSNLPSGHCSKPSDAPLAIAASVDPQKKATYECFALTATLAGASDAFVGYVATTLCPGVVTGYGNPELIPVCELVGSFANGGAVISGGLAAAFSKLAHDPPSSNFRHIAVPKPRRPRLPKPHGRYAALERRVDAAISLELRLSATVVALGTSVDRAGGAHVAHNKLWERRQMLAAASYARSSASMLTELVKESRLIAGALRKTKLAKPVVGASTAEKFIEDVAQRGLPHRLLRSLRRLGLDDPGLRTITQTVLATPPTELRRSLASAVGSPSLLEVLRSKARALKKYARRVSHHPSVIQP